MKLSVVICYKDWGLTRLEAAVQHLRRSLEGISSEILISDYGSTESPASPSRFAKLGAEVIYTETDGVWSRSRALNAGLKNAVGEIFVATDADMVFTPEFFNILVRTFETRQDIFVISQCRDLPMGITHEELSNPQLDWAEVSAQSKLRPRWGMGGMIAATRSAVRSIGGLDGRMEIYGGEDIDFAKRLRRSGKKLVWLDDPDAQMFHVWHPSSRAQADLTLEGRAAIAKNRDIQLNDQSIIRNLASISQTTGSEKPTVSIVISTKNRAHYLSDAIQSVLAQTVTNWELLIIDDGSTDETKKVVEQYEDSRIRYFYQASSGLAKARNFGTSMAQGDYVAVMDDDDLMLPDRLESSLETISAGVLGAYGGWIDFDESTCEITPHQAKPASLSHLLYTGSVYLHPTLLIRRDVLLAVGYREFIRSGSDYDLAVRLQRAGVKLKHCGKYVLMRRRHPGQVTSTDSDIQKGSGRWASFFGLGHRSWKEIKTAREETRANQAVSIDESPLQRTALALLPDEHVFRSAMISFNADSTLDADTNQLVSTAKKYTVWQQNESPKTTALIQDITLQAFFSLQSDPSIEVDDVKVWERSQLASSAGSLETIEESFDSFRNKTVLSYLSHSVATYGQCICVETSDTDVLDQIWARDLLLAEAPRPLIVQDTMTKEKLKRVFIATDRTIDAKTVVQSSTAVRALSIFTQRR
ncbi:glycosyltransferase family 2 protein [Brevibacterium paucivorans]|uniref:Glycosyltransferase 2-like domain-containing protein n=1 Tax=Brevibacterium paucivorans TaxID=170994 RepID=A0A2N6VLH2_9MICO|nr:glycosyltransferase [Brevibacterium paucivorans]PMD04964.1 hypothetical protein CJ199_07650 [Brevibacterium paucivorans]